MAKVKYYWPTRQEEAVKRLDDDVQRAEYFLNEGLRSLKSAQAEVDRAKKVVEHLQHRVDTCKLAARAAKVFNAEDMYNGDA